MTPSLFAGDLIVDHCAPPDSTHGIALAMTPTLVVESLDLYPLPCRVLQLHRSGFQCQTAEDRLSDRDPHELAVYRLTAWERLTLPEADHWETVIRGMLRETIRSMPSAVVIARILMRLGKLPRLNRADLYTTSILVSTLIENEVYEHVGVPQYEPAVLPSAA